MKAILTVILLLGTNVLFAQSYSAKSDLRIRIDSIIEHQIGYKIDSTTDKQPVRKWDTTKTRGLYPDFSSLPPNPLTLILLDTDPISLDELNKYKLSGVEILKVYKKNDSTTAVLYGNRAKNGLIVLKTKK
jgi:hypothetical protein